MELRQSSLLIGILVLFMSFYTLAESRHPASLSPTLKNQIYPLDRCEVNCAGEETLSRELVEVYDYMKTQNTSDIEYGKLVPAGLQSVQDANLAVGKIADQSLQYWWNNSGAKDTPLGKNVNTIENSLKTEVDLGSQGSLKHKLNLVYDAFQTQARMKYEGYTSAEMFYQARDSSMGLQMINKLGNNKDLIFGETVRSSSDQTSEVTFKYNW